MKSYLIIWFNSEGGAPSEVNKRLTAMGFQAMQGAQDYVYDWGSNASIDDILQIGDRVQLTLKGLDVTYKIETVGGR
ncbi:MAG: hypothetical protein U9N09_02520 [Euryarchaeota archaeon]|nr:hypothetical protein [Euryarchaeota archaeon]